MNLKIQLTKSEKNVMEGNTIFKVILSKRATKEVTNAWKWYEERQLGLGDRFFHTLMKQLIILEKYPDRYSYKFRLYRETSLPFFPFIIIYKINKRQKRVLVASIFHMSRNPMKKY